MRPLERRIAAWAVALATAVAVAGGGRVQGADPPGAADVRAPDAAARCESLLHLSLPDTAITSATVVPASGAVPEYCQVQGGLETVILFEVALPTTTWNGKLLYVGGGGYNGTVPDLRHGLARGYAAAGTDTGHRGDHWDASALYEDPRAQLNYAHRGAHLVTLLAKRIVEAYYGSPERHSFFLGCSNGGKMGLMAVQRYPADFDGVVAGGAVTDRTGLMMMFQWTQRALLDAEIYLRPFAGPAASGAAATAAGGQWKVSTAGGVFPRWRRDGAELYYLGPTGTLMAASTAVTGVALAPGAPVALFPTRIYGGSADTQQGRQYDVTRDGRFLINTVLDGEAAAITLLQDWQPEAKQ
jgi:hypothetical protein